MKKEKKIELKGALKAQGIIVISLLLMLFILGVGTASAWLGDYDYRTPIEIDGNTEDLTDYQVQITLNSSNFDFSKAQSDGSDVRITDSNRTTIIPYFIESYDSIGETATIWVKVPVVPASATTTIYLYYGNPSPATFDIPPLGPFQKYTTNPVISTSRLLSENIVYDEATEKYWMIFSNFNNNTMGLAYSSDLDSWTLYENNPIHNPAGAPHILYFNNTYYLYYRSLTGGHGYIDMATSSDITGPYNYVGRMLSPTEAWEAYRVEEPYVFQDDDGSWIMFYMADSGDATEQNGYATALSPEGPWIKYDLNPVIAFGPSNSYDAGTVADPIVYKIENTYYIFYAASSTKHHPWIQAYVTTTDLVNFTKHNIVLGTGSDGEWDADNAHRGSLMKFGDYYYFSYTGYDDDNPGYKMGIAKQYAKSTAQGYPPEQVFDFYDDFSISTLQSHLRQAGGTGGNYGIADGILTLSSGTGTNIKFQSVQEFNSGYVIEARTQHPNADGTGNHSSGFGFGNTKSILKNYYLSWTDDGRFNKSLSFESTDDNYVNVSHSTSLNLSNQITIEAWIYPQDITTLYQGIVCKRIDSGEATNYAMFLHGDEIRFGFFSDSWRFHTTNVSLQANQWYHVAGVFDDAIDNIKIFVNGTKVIDEVETKPMKTNIANVTIGRNNYATQYFSGRIDEVRISDNIRYAANFTPINVPFTTDINTMALWHFDEGSGYTADDVSSNNNDGIMGCKRKASLNIYDDSTNYWIKSSSSATGRNVTDMAQTIDTNWHTQRIWWKASNDVRYQNDENSWETITINIPSTDTISAWFMADATATYSTDLKIDWVKIRKYATPEPAAITTSAFRGYNKIFTEITNTISATDYVSYSTEPSVSNLVNMIAFPSNMVNITTTKLTASTSIILDGIGTTNLVVNMPNTAVIYTAKYDGINCDNLECSFTQSNGKLNFSLLLGSEHTLDIEYVETTLGKFTDITKTSIALLGVLAIVALATLIIGILLNIQSGAEIDWKTIMVGAVGLIAFMIVMFVGINIFSAFT